jgi:methylglutaconyl-CoA hydratase
MSAGTVLLRSADARGVFTLTLNRPDRHNAFDVATLIELAEVLQTLERDTAVRAVVLTGSGNSFCAGADLETARQLATADEAHNLKEAQRLADVLAALANLPKPTVARVNGNAFGGGVGLIACCDIAVASTQARVALSEVRLGLAPATISPYVIAAMGARQAHRYFLTGESLSADEARRLGLFHEVAPPASLDQVLESIVGSLLLGGPQAQRECKELIREMAPTGGAPNEEARRWTAQRLARLRVSDEGREGVSAFLEKRKPRWAR